MLDYEEMILMRQEAREIYEDDPDCDLFRLFDEDDVLPAEYLEEQLNGWDPYSGQYVDEEVNCYDA